MIDQQYKYSEETSKIIGCAFEVHKHLGNGFQEVIYQRALEIEFKLNDIPYKREFPMSVKYKGFEIGERRVDFLIFENISVEMKAVINLEPVHLAQAKNYLEAYNLEVGLLLNFGSTSLDINRLFNKKFDDQQQLLNQSTENISENEANQENQINPGSDNGKPNQTNQVNQYNPGSDNGKHNKQIKKISLILVQMLGRIIGRIKKIGLIPVQTMGNSTRLIK